MLDWKRWALTLVFGMSLVGVALAQVAKKQAEQFRELFLELDANHDNAIERDEVPASARPSFERLLKRGDDNHNGKLEVEEYREVLLELRAFSEQAKKKAVERFKGMDKDGDGKVSREEFTGPKPRFDLLDRNGDGFVDPAGAPGGAPGQGGRQGRREEEGAERQEGRLRTLRAQPAAPTNPASSPSWANSIRVFAAGIGKAILRTLRRISSSSGAPALIIPPPKRMRSGSIVCISETAPTARYRAVSLHQPIGQRVAGRGRLGDRPAGDGLGSTVAQPARVRHRGAGPRGPA